MLLKKNIFGKFLSKIPFKFNQHKRFTPGFLNSDNVPKVQADTCTIILQGTPTYKLSLVWFHSNKDICKHTSCKNSLINQMILLVNLLMWSNRIIFLSDNTHIVNSAHSTFYRNIEMVYLFSWHFSKHFHKELTG